MTTRISNLGVSGMDIDATVKKLMTARRVPYDKMFQNKTLAEWKKVGYNTMYTAVKDFRTTVFTNTLQSTLMPKKASSSNETVATVTANADAANVSHDLIVTGLASGVKKTSGAAITTGTGKTTLADQFGISGSFDISITNGTTTKSVTVNSTDSIYDLVSDINKAGVNVTANYDATLDRFFLSTNDTGSKSGISFTGSSTAGASFLTGNLKLDTTAATGKDAAFSLDGVALTQQSNSFTISGVSYALKSVGGTTDNPVTVGVSGDIDKTIANVKSFVESYNAMLAKVNAATSEEKYSKYPPLTEAQRSDMTDSEAKLWDEKAKSGMLHHDSTLQQMVDSVRNDVSSPVSGISGTYTTAASLGITTGTYTEGGKLYVDETKLRAALTADPGAVNKIFGSTGDTDSKQGITVRMYDTLKTAMDKITSEAGISAGVSDDTKSSLAKKINQYTKDMATLSDKLTDIETRYYNQFNAMETALTKLANQSSWLQQQFGSNTSSG